MGFLAYGLGMKGGYESLRVSRLQRGVWELRFWVTFAVECWASGLGSGLLDFRVPALGVSGSTHNAASEPLVSLLSPHMWPLKRALAGHP